MISCWFIVWIRLCLQIIDMHGFKKIKTHKVRWITETSIPFLFCFRFGFFFFFPSNFLRFDLSFILSDIAKQRILMEIVKTMEVMDPSRSTLEDDAVSSNALLTMDDLVKDLNELKWQECCVTSLQTINAVDHHHHHHHEISNNESPALTLASEEPKRPRERLKKLIDNGADEDGDLPLTCFEYGDSQMALMCSSSAVMKWVPRKKNRSLKCIQLNANGDRAEWGTGVGSTLTAAELQRLSSSSSAFL